MSLNLSERLELVAILGEHIVKESNERTAVMEQAQRFNPWFTVESIEGGLAAIAQSFLQRDILQQWVSNYAIADNPSPKSVGMVLAGNIPMVGFHDILCTFVSGQRSVLKLSDKDTVLMDYILDGMNAIEPKAKDYFIKTERLANFDAVIATGSNNTATYFHKYFGNHPNIIRKNRNGIAILNGAESIEDLYNLGIDMFTYFGLGCRNVSKIYVPRDYNFEPLLEELHKYNDIIHHNKYKNNYDYNIALYLLNKAKFLNNGSIILMEDERIPSRIATCHFEYYDSIEKLTQDLGTKEDQIQCIVSNIQDLSLKTFDFGKAQSPTIDDYADGVDTMAFLSQLH